MMKQGYCGIGKGVDSPWETLNSDQWPMSLLVGEGQAPGLWPPGEGLRECAALNQMRVFC